MQSSNSEKSKKIPGLMKLIQKWNWWKCILIKLRLYWNKFFSCKSHICNKNVKKKDSFINEKIRKRFAFI